MTMPHQAKLIALVEDDPDLQDNYSAALRSCGYEVKCFADRKEAEAVLLLSLPDLVIIDIGLGAEYEGGFELCRVLRAKSSTLPILFLSARDSELDVISGLRLGADDYLTKDISLAQLIARVTSLFRRVDALTAGLPEEEMVTGQLRTDVERLVMRWRGELVPLTVTEFWLVHCLVRYPGQVRSRQQLMDAANLVLDDQTITAHIKRIRKKFNELDSSFACIQSVYAAGYRWVEKSS